MPAGVEVTAPSPTTTTVKVTCRMNVATTSWAAVIVTVQAPVPVHAPLQPAKREPGSAAAVNVTTVPSSKVAAHVLPHSIAAGADVTMPLPVPSRVTVSACT